MLKWAYPPLKVDMPILLIILEGPYGKQCWITDKATLFKDVNK